MNQARASWLRNPWLVLAAEVVLGAVFIAAALPKIADPPGFAHMIYNYRMLPGGLVNFLALWLPWVELFAGICLVLGVWRRGAATVVSVLLILFIAAIGFNLLRGHAVDCGCFDVKSAGKTRDQLLRDMWWVLARDVGMLALTLVSLAASFREPRRWPLRAARPAEARATG
jgi:uncharacterized membrane protein YphA (DoxX/SURF4 family)